MCLLYFTPLIEEEKINCKNICVSKKSKTILILPHEFVAQLSLIAAMSQPGAKNSPTISFSLYNLETL